MSMPVTRPAPQPAVPATTNAAPTPEPPPHNSFVTHRKTADTMRPVDIAARVGIRDFSIPGGPVGETWLRIFRPTGVNEPLPVVMYILGDRPVFGNARTRRTASKLATNLQAAVVVVSYSLSPKARYPVAVEEAYTVAAWIAECGNGHGLDGTRIVLKADSTGGGLVEKLMLMADDRGGPTLTTYMTPMSPVSPSD